MTMTSLLKHLPIIGPFLDPIGTVVGAITDEMSRSRDAQTERERIESNERIEALRFKRDAMIAAISEPWYTPRSLMGYGATIVVLKLLVWDTALQSLTHAITPNPGSLVIWLIMTIVGFYFVSKSADSIAAAIAGTVARRATQG